MSLELLRLQIADFLATSLFINSFIELDYWSLVHFIMGMLIIAGVFRYKFLKKYRKKPLMFAFVVIVIYEILEIIVWSNPITFGNFIPEPESTVNIIWDVIVGYLGALLEIRRRK